MKFTNSSAKLFILAALAASALSAGSEDQSKRNQTPAPQPAVTMAQARETAMLSVPDGQIKKHGRAQL